MGKIEIIPPSRFADTAKQDSLGWYLRQAKAARRAGLLKSMSVWDSLWYLASNN